MTFFLDDGGPSGVMGKMAPPATIRAVSDATFLSHDAMVFFPQFFVHSQQPFVPVFG